LKPNVQPPLVFDMKLFAAGCAQYVRSCAKNVVKMSIGRKPYFSQQDIFFRAYLLQMLHVKPMRKLTCRSPRSEGAGSQALTIMRAIEFASRCKLMYVHTSFSALAHADRPMDEYALAWETLFNLGLGEAHVGNEDDQHIVNFGFNFTELMRCFGIDEIHVPREALPSLKQKYRANKPPTRRVESLIVGVHIRRGEVHQGHHLWTDSSAIARSLGTVKRLLDARSFQYRVMVFSQGHPQDFSEFTALGADLQLDTDPIDAMRVLVDANILITGKSSFALVAGLLSDGIIFTEFGVPFRPDSWLQLDPSGDFDEASFCSRLEPFLRAQSV
jgi:hypothetical protein